MSFENDLFLIKKQFEHGSFVYSDSSKSFSVCVTKHFRTVKAQDKHGIYVVRNKLTGEVLYIGKGGTITFEGKYKAQDIPGRLKAMRENDVRADVWFSALAKEKGEFIIEYVFLPIFKSPALVEALLLQAYLNEFGCLPYKNKTL